MRGDFYEPGSQSLCNFIDVTHLHNGTFGILF